MDTITSTLAPTAGYKAQAGPSAAVPAEHKAADASPAQGKATSAPAEQGPASNAVVASQPVKPALDSKVADNKTEDQSLVDDTLRKLNDLTQTAIAFSQHEESGRTVITVSDKESGEQIRTIPSEDFLAIAAHLQEVLDSADGLQPGLLVSSQA
ncbi:MAG: flagellar protein FlaG [Gammaproteobacteria bacterium]|nr:flagellar protein FlaG [Gammaproteobacteria bacterium]MBQ0839516.1 flagellar protein FlaG [Gammaproteobacteria bacterium]